MTHRGRSGSEAGSFPGSDPRFGLRRAGLPACVTLPPQISSFPHRVSEALGLVHQDSLKPPQHMGPHVGAAWVTNMYNPSVALTLTFTRDPGRWPSFTGLKGPQSQASGGTRVWRGRDRSPGTVDALGCPCPVPSISAALLSPLQPEGAPWWSPKSSSHRTGASDSACWHLHGDFSLSPAPTQWAQRSPQETCAELQ